MLNTNISLAQLNAMSQHNMLGHLGIEFLEVHPDYLLARMPVDHRTHQPMGLLHGGASVVLAESLGSVASMLCVADPQKQAAVGVEINANHLKSVKSGYVYGKCKALKIGRSIHVWNIEISNEAQELICVSRLTTMIIDRK